MRYRSAAILFAGSLLLNTPAIAGDSNARDVTDAKEMGERTHAFEQDLINFGVQANLKCSLMVEVVSDGGGQDHSFGGICDMGVRNKKPTTIMVCNDTMVGRLTIKAYGFTVDKNELVNFTAGNCPTGG